MNSNFTNNCTLTTAIDMILKYLWVPIVVPLLILIIKFIVTDRLLWVKEIKKITDSDIESFINLYNNRIDNSMRICVEEILNFVGRNKNCIMQHHLFVCKKINKTVGFVKFMISKELKYIFIAYIAVDKDDRTANNYCIKKMVKKLSKKFFKPPIANSIIIETVQTNQEYYVSAMTKVVSRYASILKKNSYYIDIPYLQPNMPDEDYSKIDEKFLSLIYIPYYDLDNNIISKNELLKIIESIYMEIYSPSCNNVTCNCEKYNLYLKNLLEIYYEDFPEHIKLILI